MSAATKVASLVVQQFGFGGCEQCLPREQQMCPDPWFHLATAVCHACEGMREYRACHAEDCPACAIARFSATCKAAAARRDPKEVQARAQMEEALREQFHNVKDPPSLEDFETASFFN